MKPLNNKYKALVWLLVTVVALVFLWQGMALLFAAPDTPIYAKLAHYGLLRWTYLIAFWELGIAALFFIPQTNRVGYLLAMIHWGGMFFLQLSQGQPVALILYLMILTTGVNYVRNPTMFLRKKEQAEGEGKNLNKIDDSKTILNKTKQVPRRLPTTIDGTGTHSYKSEHHYDAPQSNNTEVHYANQ